MIRAARAVPWVGRSGATNLPGAEKGALSTGSSGGGQGALLRYPGLPAGWVSHGYRSPEVRITERRPQVGRLHTRAFVVRDRHGATAQRVTA